MTIKSKIDKLENLRIDIDHRRRSVDSDNIFMSMTRLLEDIDKEIKYLEEQNELLRDN